MTSNISTFQAYTKATSEKSRRVTKHHRQTCHCKIRESTQTIAKSLSRTLWVMDVCANNPGRSPKSLFSCGPGGGEKPFDPCRHPSLSVWTSAGKSGPKDLSLCCFFLFPAHCEIDIAVGRGVHTTPFFLCIQGICLSKEQIQF